MADAGDVNNDGVGEIMFSNYAAPSAIHRVWVCKYTGPGVEEISDFGFRNADLKISQNPFIKSTIIKYFIPVRTRVILSIYDISGSCVKTFINGEKEAGNYSISLNAKELKTGIYFVKLTAGNYKETKKLILIK